MLRCGFVAHALWAAFACYLLSVVIVHDDVRTISQLGKSLQNVRNSVQCPLFSIQTFCRVRFFHYKSL